MLKTSWKYLTTVIFATTLGGAVLLCAAEGNPADPEKGSRRRHILSRMLALVPSACGSIGALCTNLQSDSLITPYTKAAYIAHLSARPQSLYELGQTLHTIAGSLSPLAQFTLGATALGGVAGFCALAHGTQRFLRSAKDYISAKANQKDTTETWRGMRRGLGTVTCGIIACVLSGFAGYNIIQGVGKTLDTHEPLLGTISTIRTTLRL